MTDDEECLALLKAHEAKESADFVEKIKRSIEDHQALVALHVLTRSHDRIKRLAAHGYTLQESDPVDGNA